MPEILEWNLSAARVTLDIDGAITVLSGPHAKEIADLVMSRAPCPQCADEGMIAGATCPCLRCPRCSVERRNRIAYGGPRDD
jgi:hypothetical protein